MTASRFSIHLFHSGDEDAVYEVCLKTGDAGQDASSLYSDPKALGHLFVGPYLRLEPELAFVLVDSSGVCGYALGALDSERFFVAYLNEWLPQIRRAHPEPSGDPAQWTLTQRIYHQYYRPRIFFPDSFKDYPSHLHIDLLPRAQGRGNGSRMMQVLLEALRNRASPGVHLSMAASNRRAEKFYRKLGFVELARVDSAETPTLYFGKRL